MPMSVDVNLPLDHEPIFPDQCVGCGQPRPNTTFRVTDRTINWFSLTFWSKQVVAEVPVCEFCRRSMERQRVFRTVMDWVGMIAAIAVASLIFAWYSGAGKRIMVTVLAILLLAPLFVWQIFVPPPFSISALTETVDYEFRDRAYAEAFAELNGGTIDDD